MLCCYQDNSAFRTAVSSSSFVCCKSVRQSLPPPKELTEKEADPAEAGKCRDDTSATIKGFKF